MIRFIIALGLLNFINSTPGTGLQVLCDKDESTNVLIVLSNDDIAAYNWHDHQIILTENGISHLKGIKITGQRFAIYLNGIKLYDGKFENAVKSEIGIECPAILISPGESNLIVIDGNQIKIWYFGHGPDPRDNSRLKDYLNKKNLLR